MTQIDKAIEITHLNITLPKLPPHFDGLSIVQVSDWHLGQWMTIDRIMAISQLINDLRPDIIVVTGDFVGLLTPDSPSDLTRALATLHAPEGIFAILGNHDYWASAQRCAALSRRRVIPAFC
jgi:predicted MPP superfamily phosphohydrolase